MQIELSSMAAGKRNSFRDRKSWKPNSMSCQTTKSTEFTASLILLCESQGKWCTSGTGVGIDLIFIF